MQSSWELAARKRLQAVANIDNETVFNVRDVSPPIYAVNLKTGDWVAVQKRHRSNICMASVRSTLLVRITLPIAI